jgi:hypothetical protein
MWVSQTYLTNLRADGAVSAYFLFESYRDDHTRVERSIRSKLGKLALSFGDDAHVFIPSTEAKASIEKEFNEWLHQRGLQGIELPGVLVLQHPMNDQRSLKGKAVFISFSELLGCKPINGRIGFPHSGNRDSSSFSGALRWVAMI